MTRRTEVSYASRDMSALIRGRAAGTGGAGGGCAAASLRAACSRRAAARARRATGAVSGCPLEMISARRAA